MLEQKADTKLDAWIEKYQQEIDRWILGHQQEMKEELMAWVSHPSVSRSNLGKKNAPYGDDCKRMLDFALNRGKDYGFQTADYEGYCGDILYGEQEEELGFVCHLDVVPEGEGWLYEPYQPMEKDGYLIGRGVSDNKGAAVLVLYAFRFFREKGIPLQKKLRLLLGCAEETGMDDFRYYLNELKGKVPPVSIIADASFPVCYAQKGGFNGTILIPAGNDIVDFRAGKVRNIVPDQAKLVIRNISIDRVRSVLAKYQNIEVLEEDDLVVVVGHGKAGHAAFPEGTLNAIGLVAQAVTQSGLIKMADLSGISFLSEALASPYGEKLGIGFSDEESGKLTFNAGVIEKRGGQLRLVIDIRYPVTITDVQIEELLREKLKNAGASLTEINTAKPYYISPKDDKVVALTEIYNTLTGNCLKPYTMGGGTYSRVIPGGINFGPGFQKKRKPAFLPEGHGSAHGPDEVLYLEDWFLALKIYIYAILKLAG